MPVTRSSIKSVAGQSGSVLFSAAEAPAGSLVVAILFAANSSNSGMNTQFTGNTNNTGYTALTQAGVGNLRYNPYVKILDTAGIRVGYNALSAQADAMLLVVVYTGHGITSIASLSGADKHASSVNTGTNSTVTNGAALSTNANNGGLFLAVNSSDVRVSGTVTDCTEIGYFDNTNNSLPIRAGVFEDNTLDPSTSIGNRTYSYPAAGKAGGFGLVIDGPAEQPISDADTATGTEDASLVAVAETSDSATATDSGSLLATASVTDSATGTDDSTLGISTDDSATGTDDVVDLFKFFPIVDNESATASDDFLAIGGTLSSTEDATANESFAIDAAMAVSDSAVGTEDAYITILTDDSGTATDIVTVATMRGFFNDSAVGTDTFSAIVGRIYDTDTAEGTDDGTASEKEVRLNDLFEYKPRFYTKRKFRVLAQNVLTKAWVHNDLPILNPELTLQYNSPNLFRGTIKNAQRTLENLNPALTPEVTWLHCEENEEIIASFLYTPPVDNNSSKIRDIEGVGFSAYLSWLEYQDKAYKGIQVDPADLVRLIWNEAQRYGRGKLGVTLNPDTKTPVRLGTEPKQVEFETGAGEQVSFEAGPWDLNWWEVSNLGTEMEKLMTDTPMEYIERSGWNADRTDVWHYFDYRYPRIGRRQDNVQFKQGENLIVPIPGYNETKEGWPSDIIVVGAGEGPTAIRGWVSRYTGRLRRTKTIQDETIKSKAEAQIRAENEARKIDRARFFIDSIIVKLDHVNAPMGSWSAGDDVFVQAKVINRDKVSGWFRIPSWVYRPGNSQAEISLAPSDTFQF